ncbi:hypothetical protein C8J57DRAFT_1217434 [Mycena rebaudengoi]|nr:hypothetical protein C8J57DRAFT_1217434 [Mycena rebaudengoi]
MSALNCGSLDPTRAFGDLPALERRRVVRPQAEVTTPEYMWIIPSSRSKYLPSMGSDLMIRQEYYNLITGGSVVLAPPVSSHPTEAGLPRATQQVDDMEVDERSTGPPARHIQGDNFSQPLQAPTRGFLQVPGKRFFLSAIFHLRVLAGLPTAYMQCDYHMLVYTGEQLFVLEKLSRLQLLCRSRPGFYSAQM